jgi:hypothetical protein
VKFTGPGLFSRQAEKHVLRLRMQKIVVLRCPAVRVVIAGILDADYFEASTLSIKQLKSCIENTYQAQAW